MKKLLVSLLIFNVFFFFPIQPAQAIKCPENKIGFDGNCYSILKNYASKTRTEISEDTTVNNKVYHPAGIAIGYVSNEKRVYIVDAGNNRILGFRGENTNTPNIILGQLNGVSNECNKNSYWGKRLSPTNSSLCFLSVPDSTNIQEYSLRLNIDIDDDGNLYVPDVHNNRVLVYYDPLFTKTSGGKGDGIADFVIGQKDFNTSLKYEEEQFFSPSSSNVNISEVVGFDNVSTRGVSVDKDKNVWVADTFYGRVLRFPSNSKKADLVIGKSNFINSNLDGGSACDDVSALDKLCTPTLAKVNPDTGDLFVLDERPDDFKSRILVFNPPFKNGMKAKKIIIPKQVGGFTNSNWEYYFQGSGFTFNTYKSNEYARGIIWVTERMANRILLLDMDGNILKTIGAPNSTMIGCDYTYYSACYGEDSIFTDYNLCWPLGSVAMDNQNNLYALDEMFHRVSVFNLPYKTNLINNNQCIEKPSFGYFGKSQTSPNKVGPINIQTNVGVAIFEKQLIVNGAQRYMFWNDYLDGKDMRNADGVIGQINLYTRDINDPSQLGNRSYFAIDKHKKLWSSNAHGKLIIYRLPLSDHAKPLNNFIKLYWKDSNKEIDYHATGISYDGFRDKIWVVDNKNNRILRISNYSQHNSKLYVDAVIGQNSKNEVKCNHNQDSDYVGTVDGLCSPLDIEFDKFGNLFVIENNFECHGNNRISMFEDSDLDRISSIFPRLKIKKVFNKNSATEPALCDNDKINEPASPTTLTFSSNNNMVVGNDGYYQNKKERPYKQLWLYMDPLQKDKSGAYIQGQKPDASINLNLGSAGQVLFDNLDNLIVQDHTYNKIWIINFYCDKFLVDWVGFSSIQKLKCSNRY